MARQEVQLLWSNPALQQLHDAYAFIALDKPSAAARMVDRIEQATHQLRAFPQMGRPSARPKTREFAVPQTPFILVYQVTGETVYIAALLHGAQNWKGNL